MTPRTIEGPPTERAKSLQPEEDVSRTFSLQQLAHNLARFTVGSSWQGTRCWLGLWQDARSEAPWLPLARADSGPCAVPICGPNHLSGSATLLYACRSAEYRWPGRYACRRAC